MAERSQVFHLSLLVDDLMDVARISKGKLEPEGALRGQWSFKAREGRLARPSRRSAWPQIAEPGPRADRRVPPGAEEPIPSWSADPTRLEQILDNLLTNSIKYTEPGGRIVLSAESGRGTRP